MADYLTGLLIQVKGTDVTGVPNGGAITTVTPTVGPALTPANSGEPPLYATNQFLGGLPGIVTGPGQSGVSRALLTTSLTSTVASFTFAFVLKSGNGVQGILSDISSDRFLVDLGNGAPGFGYFAGGGFLQGGSGITDSLAHTIIYVLDAGASQATIYYDGTQVYQNTYSAHNINSGARVVIGGSSDVPPSGAGATIAEARLYAGALAPTQVANVNQALTATYIAATSTATALGMTSPANGAVGVAQTLTLTANGTLGADISVTLSDGGKGGTFASNPLTISASSSPSATVAYTPAAAGATTFTASKSGLTSATATSQILPAQSAIAVTNAALYFSPQNWVFNGSTYAQAWSSNAYFKTRFTGTSFTLLVDPTTFGSVIKPTIRVWVDNASPVDVQVSNATAYVLASGLATGTHTLRVAIVRTEQVSDRWSGTNNTLRITGFSIDQGSALSAPTIAARKMAYFGDSITEGIDALSNNPDYAGTDGTVTFAALVANALSVEFCQVGNGGQAFTGGSSQSVPGFVQSHAFIQSGVARDLTQFDYIFENLGTNGGVVPSDLTAWLVATRAAAPAARIVVVMPFNANYVAGTRTNITNAFNTYQSGHPSDTNVYLVDGGNDWDMVHTNPAYSYDGLHYSTAGHQQIYNIAQAQVAALAIVPPTVTAVTVTPASPTVTGGASQTFTGAATGTNNPPDTFTWTASAGTITANNPSATAAFVAPAATSSAQTITITAHSTVAGYTSVAGTATVTVPATSGGGGGGSGDGAIQYITGPVRLQIEPYGVGATQSDVVYISDNVTYELNLFGGNSLRWNITGATVTATTSAGGTVISDAVPVIIVRADLGQVQYTLSDNDTASARTIELTVRVVDVQGNRRTFGVVSIAVLRP